MKTFAGLFVVIVGAVALALALFAMFAAVLHVMVPIYESPIPTINDWPIVLLWTASVFVVFMTPAVMFRIRTSKRNFVLAACFYLCLWISITPLSFILTFLFSSRK